MLKITKKKQTKKRNLSLLLLSPSTVWLGPTHIMKDNLLYLKSTDYTFWSHLKSISTATTRLVFDQTTGHHNLAKLTCKTNHHMFLRFTLVLWSFSSFQLTYRSIIFTFSCQSTLRCIHFSGVVNKAAINIHVPVPLCTYARVLKECRNGIAGL